MKKAGRIIAIVAGTLAALILLLLVGLQIFLNSGKARALVDKVAASAIDGRLEYGRLRFDLIKTFPNIRASVQDLCLTYPHSRFAAAEGAYAGSAPLAGEGALLFRGNVPLADAGRGEDADTLAAFRSFSASVNPWRLLRGRIRLSKAELEGLKVYAHAYGDSLANWQIFKGSDTPKDSSAGISLPAISIGRISIKDCPTIIYTSEKDSLAALLQMKEMALRGAFRLPGKKSPLQITRLSFLLDSLSLQANLASDRVGLDLERLSVVKKRRSPASVQASALASLSQKGRGRLEIPLSLSAVADYSLVEERSQLTVSDLALRAADIPLEGDALLHLREEGKYIKASLRSDPCPVGATLKTLGNAGYLPVAQQFATDAVMSLSAEAEGVLGEGTFPEASLRAVAGQCRFDYLPLDFKGSLSMALTAFMSASKRLDAEVRSLNINSDGLHLALAGRASDLLGGNPAVKAHMSGDADLAEVQKFISDSLRLSGKVDLTLDADASLAQIKNLDIPEGGLSARISSPLLALEAPSDSLIAALDSCQIFIKPGSGGISADLGIDTLSYAKGSSMQAKVRGSRTVASLTKVDFRGKKVPRIEVGSDNRRVYLRSGDSRLGSGELKISASVQRRVKIDRPRRRGRNNARRAAWTGDFTDKNIRLSLGEAVDGFIRNWTPAANVSMRKGWFASPRLPLRNRIKELDLQYAGDAFDINNLQLTSGTSDLSLTGKVTGLRRTILGKGFLKGDLNLSAGRLNLNEFLTALKVGRESDYEPVGEQDESFVTDTLADAQFKPDSAMKVIVVPANLNAEIALHANIIDYSDVTVSPLDADVKIADRCLQLTGAKLTTNLGNIALDAFYATRSKQDIQLGADLQLLDMSAAGIIHMLPSVDDMMPALKSFRGNLGCRVSLTSQLDTMMNLIIPSLEGLVRVTGQDLEVRDAGKLRKITRLLLFKNKNIGHIDDLAVDAIIENSRVEIYPFILGVDRYKLALMGVQGLDKSMRYNISVLKNPIFPVRFGINIYGNLDDFSYSLGRSKYRNGKVPVFTQEINDIQYNIGEAIRNVFDRGVENAVAATEQGYINLKKRKKELGYDTTLPEGFLSNEEYKKLQAKAFEEEMEEYNALVEAEVDAALAASQEN